MDAPDTRYVAVGDAEVAYQIVGEGPLDLVYHHGLCHLDLQWDVAPEAAFNERLASFSRLILFDRRGTGASERGPRDFVPTWEEWSEDLRAVLDAAGSESAAIFAEGEAGPTAILFAAAHPERVRALQPPFTSVPNDPCLPVMLDEPFRENSSDRDRAEPGDADLQREFFIAGMNWLL